MYYSKKANTGTELEMQCLIFSFTKILIVLRENSVLYCVHSNLNAWPFIHDTKGDPSSNFVIVQ